MLRHWRHRRHCDGCLRRAGRIPPHLLGGEIPLDVDAARDGVAQLASKLELSPEARATGILEISAWNQANALRQITVQRGLDVRDFTLTTFGGSGSLLLCRLVDVLDIPTVFGAARPRQRFGVRLTHSRREERLRPDPGRAARAARRCDAADGVRRAGRAGRRCAGRRGLSRGSAHLRRTADLRYFGQAFEVRVPVPNGDLDEQALDGVARAFHAEHRKLYGYDFAGDAEQQVEWVHLRVSGIGPITRPTIQVIAESGNASEIGPRSSRPVCFDATDGYVETPVYWRPDLRGGQVVRGPAILEEFGSTVPLHPGFAVRVDDRRNLIVTRES